MSIAAVQRHLAASSLGDVTLGPYFIQLCESLGASMISDPERLSIVVTVDDSVVNANVSVSLGLIITELVINALKHAFPGHRRGKIIINFRSDGPKWRLSVQDDGIGMPTGSDKAKPGLGTGMAALSAFVFGWVGFSVIVLLSPIAIILPRYITPTRSEICATTARLWAMKR